MASNAEKAEDAKAAVDAYVAQRMTESGNERYSDEPLETFVRDLLTDLRFLCAREGIEFDEAVEMSDIHFDSER
jgi:hypothetical protein